MDGLPTLPRIGPCSTPFTNDRLSIQKPRRIGRVKEDSGFLKLFVLPLAAVLSCLGVGACAGIPAAPAKPPLLGEELVVDGGFVDGLRNWSHYVQNGASAGYAARDGAAVISITVPGRIGATISENGNDVNRDGFAWSPHAVASLELGGEIMTFTADLHVKGDNPRAGLLFLFGTSKGEITLSRVTLRKIE
jgi:hypothetical protein